jgi:hypothetical protein
MHDAVHLFRWDEDAVLHPLDAKEPVACAVRAHCAFDHAADVGFLAAFQQETFARSLECTDAVLTPRGTAVALGQP